MDNIIIVGLLTMSAVVAAVLVFETITPSLGISGRSISHAQLDIATRMQTDIEIISVIPNLDPVPPAPATPVCAGGTVGCIVDAWTKNTGGADVSSIGNIDVILRRTDGGGVVYPTPPTVHPHLPSPIHGTDSLALRTNGRPEISCPSG